eukprot:scaffold4971_cov254-Pinguiococcus_pyrenoidosus.AAC.6
MARGRSEHGDARTLARPCGKVATKDLHQTRAIRAACETLSSRSTSSLVSSQLSDLTTSLAWSAFYIKEKGITFSPHLDAGQGDRSFRSHPVESDLDRRYPLILPRADLLGHLLQFRVKPTERHELPWPKSRLAHETTRRIGHRVDAGREAPVQGRGRQDLDAKPSARANGAVEQRILIRQAQLHLVGGELDAVLLETGEKETSVLVRE